MSIWESVRSIVRKPHIPVVRFDGSGNVVLDVSSVFSDTRRQEFLQTYWEELIEQNLKSGCDFEWIVKHDEALSKTVVSVKITRITDLEIVLNLVRSHMVSIWTFPVFPELKPYIDRVIDNGCLNAGISASIWKNGSEDDELVVIVRYDSDPKLIFDQLPWFVHCPPPIWEHMKTFRMILNDEIMSVDDMGYNGFVYVRNPYVFKIYPMTDVIACINNSVNKWGAFRHKASCGYLGEYWDLVLMRSKDLPISVWPSTRKDFVSSNGAFHIVTLRSCMKRLTHYITKADPQKVSMRVSSIEFDWIDEFLSGSSIPPEFPGIISLPVQYKDNLCEVPPVNKFVEILCFSPNDAEKSQKMLKDLLQLKVDYTEDLKVCKLPLPECFVNLILREISLQENVKICATALSASVWEFSIIGRIWRVEKCKLRITNLWSNFKNTPRFKLGELKGVDDVFEMDLDYWQYVSLLMGADLETSIPELISFDLQEKPSRFITHQIILDGCDIQVCLVDNDIVRVTGLVCQFGLVLCQFDWDGYFKKRVPVDTFSSYYGLSETRECFRDHNGGDVSKQSKNYWYLLKLGRNYKVIHSGVNHMGGLDSKCWEKILDVKGTLLIDVSGGEWYSLKSFLKSHVWNHDKNRTKIMIIGDEEFRNVLFEDTDVNLCKLSEKPFKLRVKLPEDRDISDSVISHVNRLCETVKIPLVDPVYKYISNLLESDPNKYPVKLVRNELNGLLSISGHKLVVKSILSKLEIESMKKLFTKQRRILGTSSNFTERLPEMCEEYRAVVKKLRESLPTATEITVTKISNVRVDQFLNVVCENLTEPKIEECWWRSTNVNYERLLKFPYPLDISISDTHPYFSMGFHLWPQASMAHARFGKKKQLFLVEAFMFRSFGGDYVSLDTSSVGRGRIKYSVEYEISSNQSS